MRRLLIWAREISLVLVIALIFSLIIKTFFFQAFHIPSSSMAPTLSVGDRILVTKWRPGPLELRRGDIVVFADPGGWLPEPKPENDNFVVSGFKSVMRFTGLLPENADRYLVKRVIGLPGDTVECCDVEGYVTINGERLQEPYLAEGIAPSLQEFYAVVPEDYVWVMGDNRPNSADSRAHLGDPGGGSIAVDSIVGSSFLTIWPLDNFGRTKNPIADS